MSIGCNRKGFVYSMWTLVEKSLKTVVVYKASQI